MINKALRRYEVLVSRSSIPAVAWAGLAIRLEILAKTVAGQTAVKLRDRAEDCRARARRARTL